MTSKSIDRITTQIDNCESRINKHVSSICSEGNSQLLAPVLAVENYKDHVQRSENLDRDIELIKHALTLLNYYLKHWQEQKNLNCYLAEKKEKVKSKFLKLRKELKFLQSVYQSENTDILPLE